MLVAYRNSVVVPEVAEALRRLEASAAALQIPGLRVLYSGVPQGSTSWAEVEENRGPTGLPPHLSMRPSGREVYLSLSKPPDKMQELALLWALAVPLGFHPWSRYPVPGPGQEVFHYFGGLSSIVDFFHSEGQGELAWPSVCAAGQVLAGTWGGDRALERKVQAHLHRLGVHCGPIDGEVGERTLGCLRALGFGGLPLAEVLPKIEKLNPPKPRTKNKTNGFLTISDTPVEGFSSGGVKLTRTPSGFAVFVGGPGRAIFEFGG